MAEVSGADRDQLLQRLKTLSPERQALLQKMLREKGGGATAIPRQPRTELDAGRVESFALSSAQQRLWFLDQWEPGNPAYSQLFRIHLRGPLDVERLQEALNAVAARHETWRTTFGRVRGEPVQQIHSHVEIPLRWEDLSGLAEAERNARALVIANEDSRTAFNLATGPMVVARLVRLSPDHHHLLLCMHHLVTDGWSSGVLLRELTALYGNAAPLPDLPIQYADFAVWQQEWLNSEALARQVDYWKERLAGPLPIVELPTDHTRPPSQAYHGARESAILPRTLLDQVQELSRKEGVSLFMTLLAAFQVLILRYTGVEDVVIGSPIANRNREELEGLMGFFANTLVMRTDLSGNPSFREALSRVRDTALSAFSNQDVPFERLVEELHPERDTSRSPLFQLMFQVVNVPAEVARAGDVEFEGEFTWDNGSSKFDLTLQTAERPEGLWCSCEYSTDLFEPATMRRFLGHWETLLRGLVARPELPIRELPILTAAERERFAGEWQGPVTGYVGDHSIPARVAALARSEPGRVAVRGEDGDYSYDELNRLSNRLAHRLLELGVGREHPVGVALHRRRDLPMALLAVLKAGGCYVPLDPSYPPERVRTMLEDSGAAVLISTSDLATPTDEPGIRTVLLDEEPLERFSDEDPSVPVRPDDLAYIIYTSGSTGRPKGVQVEHRTVCHLIETTQPMFGFDRTDIWTVVHSYAFDFSVWEIWGALLTGATLVVVPLDVVRDPAQVAAWVEREGVTVLSMTPSAIRGLSQHRMQSGITGPWSLRWVVCGGEAFPRELAPDLLTWGVPVWNFYGPTECTVWATAGPVSPQSGRGESIPVGRPLPNYQVYVLDSAQQQLPVGVPGELYIGGYGVTRGYRNRPELNQDTFLPDPFRPGGRLYRTGDLARWLDDGTVDFLGRIDHQIKLRGFRIELGEIEANLVRHEAIQETVVVAREDVPGEKRLVAYLVPANGAVPPGPELARFLEQSLPAYMVPSAFVSLEKLPLNPNGKVDRKALPAPELSRDENVELVAGRDTLEQSLVKIWEKVLKVRPIGVRDNFFDLGGHSLLAVRLFAEIEQVLGKELPLSVLFQAPTVEQLAEILRQDGWEPSWTSLVPMQPAGTRPPFFCAHGAGGHVFFYRDLSNRLGKDQPFYGLQAQGVVGSAPRHHTFQEMAAHYIKEMRTVQPEGPYYLGGACFGALVAWEVAQQLLAQGEEIGMLAMFDAWQPLRYPKYRPGVSRLHRLGYSVYRTLEHHAGSVALLEWPRKLPYVGSKVWKALQELYWWTEEKAKRAAAEVFKGSGRDLPEALQELQLSVYRAGLAYRPEYLDAKVTLFRAEKQPLGIEPDPNLGWTEMCRELEVIEAPGFHGAMIAEPRVRFLMETFGPALSAAQQSTAARN